MPTLTREQIQSCSETKFDYNLFVDVFRLEDAEGGSVLAVGCLVCSLQILALLV